MAMPEEDIAVVFERSGQIWVISDNWASGERNRSCPLPEMEMKKKLIDSHSNSAVNDEALRPLLPNSNIVVMVGIVDSRSTGFYGHNCNPGSTISRRARSLLI